MKEEFKDAIIKRDLNKVKHYLNQGIDPSINGNYAIIWASENGHLEVVKHGLNPTGLTILVY